MLRSVVLVLVPLMAGWVVGSDVGVVGDVGGYISLIFVLLVTALVVRDVDGVGSGVGSQRCC